MRIPRAAALGLLGVAALRQLVKVSAIARTSRSDARRAVRVGALTLRLLAKAAADE